MPRTLGHRLWDQAEGAIRGGGEVKAIEVQLRAMWVVHSYCEGSEKLLYGHKLGHKLEVRRKTNPNMGILGIDF